MFPIPYCGWPVNHPVSSLGLSMLHMGIAIFRTPNSWVFTAFIVCQIRRNELITVAILYAQSTWRWWQSLIINNQMYLCTENGTSKRAFRLSGRMENWRWFSLSSFVYSIAQLHFCRGYTTKIVPVTDMESKSNAWIYAPVCHRVPVHQSTSCEDGFRDQFESFRQRSRGTRGQAMLVSVGVLRS